MSRQQKRHQQASSKKKNNVQRRPSSVRLVVTPEQLIEQGKIQQAIPLLQEHLKCSPRDDEQRRLLAHCFFDTKQYQQAADTWCFR